MIAWYRNPEDPGPLPRGLRHRGGPSAGPSSTSGSYRFALESTRPHHRVRSRCARATHGPMTAGYGQWYDGRRPTPDPSAVRRCGGHDGCRSRELVEKGRTGRTQACASRPGLGDPMVGPARRAGVVRALASGLCWGRSYLLDLAPREAFARATRLDRRAERPERWSLRPPWLSGLGCLRASGGGWWPWPASGPARSQGARPWP